MKHPISSPRNESRVPDAQEVPGREARRTRRKSALAGALAAGLALLGASGCSGSDSATAVNDGSAPNESSFFFGDINSGGEASEFRLRSLNFGRLVRVTALDSEGRIKEMATDFVIRQNVVTTDPFFSLELNQITGQETLFINQNVDSAAGFDTFKTTLEGLSTGLDPIQVRGVDDVDVVFSMLPRNSALVLTFDDLLLPSSITDRTVELLRGLPPTLPFESRIFPSAYHGGRASNGQFYPTRIVMDMTTSLVEQLNTGTSVLLNGVGLPPSLVLDQPNLELRIPTEVNPSIGVTKVLVNLTDHEMATNNNGPVDFNSVARPVTRAMRSGGRADVIEDPFNGFLRDTDPPEVIGATPVDIIERPIQDAPDTNPLSFILPRVQFLSGRCVIGEVQPGDIISQSGLFASVVSIPGANYLPDGNGIIENLPVELITFPRDEWGGDPGVWNEQGAILSNFETVFDPILNQSNADCFLQFLPRPEGFPVNPAQGVDPASILSLRFSEPMDPDSLTAFDSVTIARREATGGVPLSTSDLVVGELSQSSTLRDVTFVPVQSLAHANGSAESYFFSLADASDAFPPRDLAGNTVAALPPVEFTINADAPSEFNGGRVSRFSSTDEEFPVGAEWAGQVQIDSIRQVLRARPVVRSQVVLDNFEQALLQQMTAFPPGVQTPFSPLGSKMQTIWRYCDCGFSLTDPQNINIDVEGLSWAPVGGSIVSDEFDRFEIRLSHCRFAPDEFIDPGSLFPQFRNSGLRPSYTANVLTDEVQQVVHPQERGYSIDQGEIFRTPNGTALIPFPMNQGIPDEDKRFFTWRDTTIRTRAGVQNAGVEPWSYPNALGIDRAFNPYYRTGQAQTIGLPLLMEFRTSLDLSASGQNGWVINLAVNSSSRPYFRAFSTGGINSSGNQVIIDPDNEETANGGFSPGSTPPGAATFGRDNTVHLGAMDYVARISQSYSIWFEAVIDLEPSFEGRVFSEPTVEPAQDAQPNGTELLFAYRGASEILFVDEEDSRGVNDNFSGPLEVEVLQLPDYRYNAFTLDLYGDYYNDSEATFVNQFGPGGGSPNHSDTPGLRNVGISFLNRPGDLEEWQQSVSEITGARYYQIRVTYRGNVVTGQGAELSAFALTWGQE